MIEGSRPRVMHVITGLGTGGAEASLVRVITRTRHEIAHAVVSLTTRGTRGDELAALDVPVFALGLARGAIAPGALRDLHRTVREIRPDCIQGWMYHGNLAATLLSLSGARTGPVLWNVRHALDAWTGESRARRMVIRAGAWLSWQPHRLVYNSHRAAEQRRRHDVRPGITGWAQVNGRNATTWDERFAHDLWYVDHQSLALDARILLRTIRQVFVADGIAQPGHATMPRYTGSSRAA